MRQLRSGLRIIWVLALCVLATLGASIWLLRDVLRERFRRDVTRMAFNHNLDLLEDVRRSVAEIERVRAMQREAQWGTRPATDEMQERMRQYLAGRAEMLAGDRLVLRTLQARARARQRWWLGVPLALLGTGGAILLARRRAT